MKDISQVDRNFVVETELNLPDVKFYDVKESSFKIYGVFYENGKFRRMPQAVAAQVNEGVFLLHANAAGGRVRFKTDSPYVAIRTKLWNVTKAPHIALTGSAGFDLYVSDSYIKNFMPPLTINGGYESVVELGTSEMREITINFPLYSEVTELHIGISENASVYEPSPYRPEKPIVYYGSSITQGACASRPGNCYQNIIARRLHTDYINLGFSGSARAEDVMADYIKHLDMSVFVYDYDYNAPTVEHLERTHEKMFNAIRTAHPDLPVVMMSRPTYYLTDKEEARLAIIKKTYQNAKDKGDTNVYLIEGRELMAMAGNDGTVDGVHPTDLGFMSMANALGDVLEKILQ